jgi:hypothetical protein
MTPLQQKLPSGRAVKLSVPLPIPGDERVSLVLLGNAPGFLAHALKGHLVKPIHARTAVAPRIVQTPSRSRRMPSFGTAEAMQARKDGLVKAVAYDAKRTSESGEVIDITPQAMFARETLWSVPAAQRHELVVETLRAWIPSPPDGGEQITIVEFDPSLGVQPLKVRLGSISRLETPTDHFLFELVSGTPERVVGFNPDNVILISPDGRRVVRLDPMDRRTLGRVRMLSVLATVEKLFKGLELTAEETADVGGEEPIDTPEAPALLAAPSATRAPAPTAADLKQSERVAQYREEQHKVVFPQRDAKAAPLTLGVLSQPTKAAPIVGRKSVGSFMDKRIDSPKFDGITMSYLDSGTYDRDMASIIASLANDPLMPHFVQKIERRPNSDALNHKETLSIQYRDPKGRSSTIHVDMPIQSRDGYMYLNGNTYNVSKQILAMPIIKVRPGEVLITTAYNKATVERFGQNASAAASYVRLLAARIDKERPTGVKVDMASATAANSKYRSTVEYNDIARTVRAVRGPKAAFVFSRPALDAELAKVSTVAPDKIAAALGAGGHPIGYLEGGAAIVGCKADGSIRVVRQTTESTTGGKDIGALIYDMVREAAPAADLPEPSVLQRKYMYSRVKMLSQYLPTAVIVGYDIGLTNMLRAAQVQFSIVDAGAYRKSRYAESDAIRFEDGVVVFAPTRLRDSLLINGLKELDTEDRPMSDFGPAGMGWVDHIADRLGGPGHAKALVNYQASFIDPMTRDLLAEDGLPTDMAHVLLYASAMLESNEHPESNDMASYRLRGPELVNSMLYKVLHKEMERVRATRESASPQKLMVNPVEVIRQVQAASNVEEVSLLNPLLEAELRGKATWTGAAGGLSDGRTVNRAMRAYHKSMRGIFGYYSPDSAEIGVKRTLAYSAAVKDVRGRFDLDLAATDAASVLALGELITPFVAQHADPPRIGMQSKQATHTMPIAKHTPQLVGSGAEKALAYAIGNTYAYKARKAGVFVSLDEKAQLAKIKYDDGELAYVDMSPRSVKNSGGGFYITAQLKLNPGVEPGKRFAQDDILAHDPSYFAASDDGSTGYKSGILARIAIVALDQTYEDSLMVTSKLTRDTVALVTMARSVSLGAKTNLQGVAKVGTVVQPNDSLAVFENVTDDADVSALLARVGKEFDDAIAELTRNVAVAKYAGKVVEIRTYYNKDLDQLSPSLQKFIRLQERLADERKKAGAGAPTDEPVRANAPIRITRDKVAGEIVDGVLIQFLIQVEDEAAPGDKFVCSSPLKGIVSRVFEDGEEPEDEEGNQVDYITSPLSIVSRMTSDVFLAMWSNAVLVDLKKRVLEIYNE